MIAVDDDDVAGTTVYHHLAYDVKMTSINPVRIEREDNKRPVICNASVPDQPPVKISIVPQMLCKFKFSYRFQCNQKHSEVL